MIEPWILHDFGGLMFYDKEIRLVLCGHVRPEIKFEVFEELIQAIKEDGDFCRDACEQNHADVVASNFFDQKARGGGGGMKNGESAL